MKVLILDASPRRGGTISRMIDAFIEGSPAGTDIECVHLDCLSLRPCIACMRCRTAGFCVFAGDDADLVGGKMSSCDVLVVASPTWWANMPGPLKTLFDRNVFRFMGESKAGMPVPLMGGKRGVILTACSTPFPFNWLFGQSRGLVRAVREIFRYGGIRNAGLVVCPGTKGRDEVPDAVLRRVRRLAAKLATTAD
jgi:NAD(P)H-dependent FMN reductase